METRLLNIALQFDLEGTVAEIKPLGEGFINDTFVIHTEGDAPDYILQRKNHIIFPDVPGMMENIKAVTEHIKAKVADPMRETLTVIPAKDGKLYVKEGENFWAVCLFIPDTTSPVRADTPELAYQGGLEQDASRLCFQTSLSLLMRQSKVSTISAGDFSSGTIPLQQTL